MDGNDSYRDTRADLWSRAWDAAGSYDDHLRPESVERVDRWRAMEAKIPPLTEGQEARLNGFGRTLRVLVLSGAWCGDCVRQVPMIRRVAEACGPEVELRCIDREAMPELRDELRILGGCRVPVAVFLSEDFFEAGRFGDRSLTAYRSKLRREAGPACDPGIVPPPQDELAAEQEEWVQVFERMLLMLRLAPMLRKRHGD